MPWLLLKILSGFVPVQMFAKEINGEAVRVNQIHWPTLKAIIEPSRVESSIKC